MVEVKFYDTVNDELLKFAVIISQSNGKWAFCKHKERDTYEVPGGHREAGEDIFETAKRGRPASTWPHGTASAPRASSSAT